MKKNSLEARKKQHEALIEAERREQERKARKETAKAEKKVQQVELGEVEMESKKQKFKRRVLPRREYKAKRRLEKLAKYAPRILLSDGAHDIDMGDINKPKKVIPVSKTLRLVKNKDSIRK